MCCSMLVRVNDVDASVSFSACDNSWAGRGCSFWTCLMARFFLLASSVAHCFLSAVRSCSALCSSSRSSSTRRSCAASAVRKLLESAGELGWAVRRGEPLEEPDGEGERRSSPLPNARGGRIGNVNVKRLVCLFIGAVADDRSLVGELAFSTGIRGWSDALPAV